VLSFSIPRITGGTDGKPFVDLGKKVSRLCTVISDVPVRCTVRYNMVQYGHGMARYGSTICTVKYGTVPKAGNCYFSQSRVILAHISKVKMVWLTYIQCRTKMHFLRGKANKKIGVKKQKTQRWPGNEPRTSFFLAKRQNTVDRTSTVFFLTV